MKKSFIVIGLGRFGSSVAITLAGLNSDLLAVDIDEEAVENSIIHTLMNLNI